MRTLLLTDRFPTPALDARRSTLVVPSRRRARHFKFQSVTVPYLEYRRGRYRYFALFYYDNGRRRRDTRSTYTAAKARAEEIAKRIANGETNMLSLREADKACYMRSLEIIAPTKQPLELVCSIYTDSVQMLPPGVTLQEAIKYFIENRPADFIPKNTPALVADFLAQKKTE